MTTLAMLHIIQHMEGLHIFKKKKRIQRQIIKAAKDL